MNSADGKIFEGTTSTRRPVKLTGPVIAVLVIIVIVVGVYPSISAMIVARNSIRQASELVARGESQLLEGKIEDAVFSFMKAAKLSPTQPGVNLALGKALMLNGNGDASLDALGKELAIDENSVECHLLSGFLYLLKSSRPDALGSLLRVEFPKEMGYPGMAGTTPLFEINEGFPLTDALYHFKYVEETEPHDVRAALGLAVMKALQGNLGEAEKRLTDIIERDPDNEFAAIALVRIPHLLSQPGFGAGNGMTVPPGMIPPGNQDALPPLDSVWLEGDGLLNPETDESSPTEPPDISDPVGKELPTEYNDPDFSDVPDVTVNEDGDIVITQGAFEDEPVTRPVGPITILPGGDLSTALVKVGNRFEIGSITLINGQKGEVPNTGKIVEVIAIPQENKVIILEDGIRFTWLRGKVEWVLVTEDKTIDKEEPSEE